MSAPRPRLVVRDHAPARSVLLGAGVLLLLVASVWFSFEFGRGRAGFDGGTARTERAALKEQIATLEEQLRTTRLKLALYESESTGQLQERTDLSRTIGELQAEVARLTSDVAFYRGIVEQRTTGDVVKVQQFRVSAGKARNEFLLRLVLGRPLRPEDNVSGKARITIEGQGADGSPASLDLMQLAGVPGGELQFNLRFVQTLEQAVTLPQGFAPSRVLVELLPARKGVNPMRESFLWSVEN